MTGSARRAALLLWLVFAASAARATPNVPLEDPVYVQLAQLRAEMSSFAAVQVRAAGVEGLSVNGDPVLAP